MKKSTLVAFGNFLLQDRLNNERDPQMKDSVTHADLENFFETQKTQTENLTFGEAIEALKSGAKVARSGWNGKDMFLYLVPGSTFKVNRAPLLGIYEEGTEINYRPHMDLKTADGSVATWSPSGSDALAEDWIILQ